MWRAECLASCSQEWQAQLVLGSSWEAQVRRRRLMARWFNLVMTRWLLQQRHYLHIRRGPWQMQRLNHWELPFLRFLSVRQSLYHSLLLRWWWYDNFNGFQKNLSQSRLLNTDYSHPSSHICLRFPSKISPMPPGEAESGVEARSACKHHSTMAGRACVVVYLCCCLLVLSSTCVVVCHLSSLSSHQFVGICETRGTGKEEKQETSEGQ